jgi:hypothetical protein
MMVTSGAIRSHWPGSYLELVAPLVHVPRSPSPKGNGWGHTVDAASQWGRRPSCSRGPPIHRRNDKGPVRVDRA